MENRTPLDSGKCYVCYQRSIPDQDPFSGRCQQCESSLRAICGDCEVINKSNLKILELNSGDSFVGEKPCNICGKSARIFNAYITPEVSISKTINAWADFNNLGAQFCEKQPIYFDKNQIWWLWDFKNFKWVKIDEIDLFNQLDAALLSSSFTINRTVRGEILEALKRIGRKNQPEEVPRSWVQFDNVIVDIETLETHKPASKYFITNPIPWALGQSEETPVLDKIFDEWVGKEYRDTLYEIIAFCVIPNYFMARLFCFVGAGSNGKSKCLELITKFVGIENSTSSDLDSLLSSRFEASKLHKKLICLMGETNFKVLENTDVIKRLTGEDLVSVEFKNKNPFTYYNYAKILISTNTLPPTLDKTAGFYRRWTILTFSNKFSEKKNILADIPEVEYNNLAKKCITILRRLWLSRSFTNEGTILERETRYEELSNPLGQYLKKSAIEDPNGHIFKFELEREFEAFCKNNGHRIWSSKQIGSYMKEKYETQKVQAEWHTRESNDRPWINAWVGLKFRDSSLRVLEKPIVAEISRENVEAK